MALNKNNFLRFTGSFTKRSYSFTANVPIFNLYANVDSVIIQPFSLMTSDIGFDATTFKILWIRSFGVDITLEQDCYYDGNGNLTVYRPTDLTVTTFAIQYSISDYSGNSISSYCTVNVSAVSVAWVVYPLSQVCLLDSFGNNTGYSYFSELKLQNALTHTDISPLTLKPNVPSDPDYIAPVTDYVTCPNIAATYSPLFVSNYSLNHADVGNLNDFITITNIYLYSATGGIGGTPITLNIPCNIPNGVTFRINVPAIAWDTISITYSVQAGGNMNTANPPRYWKSQSAGAVLGFGPSGTGLADNLVDNSGILTGTGILTVPPNPSGITIFAQ